MGLLEDFSAPGFGKTGGEYWQNSISFATENVIKGEKNVQVKRFGKVIQIERDA